MFYRNLILTIIIALASTYISRSQCLKINLIKNPGLEEYSCCPNTTGMIDCANYWTQPIVGIHSSSEYYNICGIDSLLQPNFIIFFDNAYFGNGYSGIRNYDLSSSLPAREYLQGTLSEPLIAGQCLYCEFWVKLFNGFRGQAFSEYAAIDAVGIFFSDTLPQILNVDGLPMAMYYPAQINNQTGRIITDTVNWTKISDTFVAKGGEKYFTVGTFKQENEINKIYYGSAHRNVSYYFFDNFSLCPCEDTIAPKELPYYFTVYPNPNNGIIWVDYNQAATEKIEFEIYDILGRKVYTNELKGGENKFTIYGEFLSSGVYYYRAVVGQRKIGKGKLVVIR